MTKKSSHAGASSLPSYKKTASVKITDQEHAEVVKELATNCTRVWFEISWFSQRRQAAESTRSLMVGAVHGKTSGFSIAMRLVTSKHPLVKELLAAKKAIFDFRDSHTAVIAANIKKTAPDTVISEDAGAAEEDSSNMEDFAREISRGFRLLPKNKIEEFWNGFWERVKIMMDQAKRVQENMAEIKAMDKELLGDAFDETLYPDDLVSNISVQGPLFQSFDVSMDLPPAVYQAQLKDIEMQLSATVGTAMTHIGDQIIEAFTLLSSRLVSPHVVKPKDPEYKKYHGAEIRMTRPSGVVDGVDMTDITLRWESGSGKKKQFVEETISLPEDTWQNILLPTPTSSKHKLFSSSMDNVIKVLENFDNVKQMLGQYGQGVDEQLGPVRTMVAKLAKATNGTADEIMDLLRSTPMYRQDLADTMFQVAANVQSVLTETSVVGRRISSKYLNKTDSNE